MIARKPPPSTVAVDSYPQLFLEPYEALSIATRELSFMLLNGTSTVFYQFYAAVRGRRDGRRGRRREGRTEADIATTSSSSLSPISRKSFQSDCP